jgi:hypothetical protein
MSTSKTITREQNAPATLRAIDRRHRKAILHHNKELSIGRRLRRAFTANILDFLDYTGLNPLASPLIRGVNVVHIARNLDCDIEASTLIIPEVQCEAIPTTDSGHFTLEFTNRNQLLRRCFPLGLGFENETILDKSNSSMFPITQTI